MKLTKNLNGQIIPVGDNQTPKSFVREDKLKATYPELFANYGFRQKFPWHDYDFAVSGKDIKKDNRRTYIDYTAFCTYLDDKPEGWSFPAKEMTHRRSYYAGGSNSLYSKITDIAEKVNFLYEVFKRCEFDGKEAK